MRANLTIFILISSLLQVSAVTFGQNLTFKQENVTLTKLFYEIRKQTGYDVLLEGSKMDSEKKVNVNFSNTPLDKVMKQIVLGTNLTYEIGKKTILIQEKDNSFSEYNALTLENTRSLIDIEGTVVDENGKALPSANIMVKNNTPNEIRLVTTNKEGYFSLKGVDEKATLLVTYVGYKLATMPVQKRMNITMVPDMAKLQEVVVSSGYDRVAKDRLTGAAAGVNEEQYRQRVAVTGNFLESLEGKVAGLVYNPQTNQLSVRGVSSFNAVNQPLIVVDGFPTNIDLSTINPNDIISVNVLKDAATASIYGVRASNGVIVVETRRGRSGKTMVNANVTTALRQRPDFSYLNYAPASDMANIESAALTASNQVATLFTYNSLLGYPLDAVQQVRVNQYLNLINATQAAQQIAAIGSYDNLADYERLFYRDRYTSNVNLDVSGGSARSTYMLGFNYVGDKLNQQRSDNDRFIVNLANTFELNSRMKFDFKGTYTNSINTSGNLPAYTTFRPYEPLLDANGNAAPTAIGVYSSLTTILYNTPNTALNNSAMALGLYDNRFFPYRELTDNTNTIKISSIQLQGRLNTRLTGWLTFDIGGNYQNETALTDNLRGEQTYDTRLLLNLTASKDAATGRANFITVPQGNILQRTNSKTVGYTIRGQFNVNKSFNNGTHDFSALLGVEQRKTTSDGYLNTYFGYDGQTLLNKPYNLNGIAGAGAVPAAFPTVLAGIILPTAFASGQPLSYFNVTNTDNRFMSYYAQGTYIYKQKYQATGSIRMDQSNLFGTDPQYRNRALWSAGLGWRLSKEDFLKDVSWINELKLRGSAGFTGNIPSNGNGKYMLLTSSVSTVVPGSPQRNNVSNPQNESLRWEVTRNYNIGLDYSLFDSRLSGAIDYYLKRSTDLYGTFESDPTSGFNSYLSNTASMENKGLEISLNSLNLRSNKFSWRTGLTTSFNRNKVTAIKATDYAASYTFVKGARQVVGQPMNALYSYNYGGLTNLGQPFVLNQAGQRVIINQTTTDIKLNDLVVSGTTVPKYVVGLNNQFSLGDFDLSFLLMYYGGHVMRVEAPLAGSNLQAIPLQGASAYWKQPGDELNMFTPPALPQPVGAAGYYHMQSGGYSYLYANQFVRKADYISLRDIVLTYNIRSAFLTRAGIGTPQLRFQAQNAFRYTFSGNDVDPEAIDPVLGVRTLRTSPYYSLSLYLKF